MAHEFDELSKVLAGRVPRREALQWIGGGLAGAALAVLGLGKASAAPNRCAVFCSQFSPGPRRAACKQACQRCDADVRRLCFGETNVVCCPPGGSCCSSSTGAAVCCPPENFCCGDTCCPFGASCCSGSAGFFCCAGNCCGDTCCPSDEFCQAGQCVQEGFCTVGLTCGGDLPFCGEGAGGLSCFCAESVEGSLICGNDFFCDTPSCTSSAECEELFGSGSYCQAADAGCCGQVCVPPCGTLPSSTTVTGTGRTNSGR